MGSFCKKEYLQLNMPTEDEPLSAYLLSPVRLCAGFSGTYAGGKIYPSYKYDLVPIN